MQAGPHVDFRAIHDMASRMTQAAYEGWKKDALAHIGHRTKAYERQGCASGAIYAHSLDGALG